MGLRKGPGPNHPHCCHHLPQHSSLEAVSWTLPRLIPPPRRTHSFPGPPLMVSPAATVKLGHHLLRVALPTSGWSPPQGSHKHKSIIPKGRRNGEHPHIWRKGRRLWSQNVPTLSVRPLLSAPVLPHQAPSPCLSAPQPCLSPVPTANGGGMGWTQHPHLGTGPPALGSGSQQGRHSGRTPLCCHSGLARRAVALGHTHPHLLHTPSPGSQPGKHSGKSRAGSHRPLCHKGPGSACTRPHLPRARGPESHLYAPQRPCAPLSLPDLHHFPFPLSDVLLPGPHHSASLSVSF